MLALFSRRREGEVAGVMGLTSILLCWSKGRVGVFYGPEAEHACGRPSRGRSQSPSTRTPWEGSGYTQAVPTKVTFQFAQVLISVTGRGDVWSVRTPSSHCNSSPLLPKKTQAAQPQILILEGLLPAILPGPERQQKSAQLFVSRKYLMQERIPG